MSLIHNTSLGLLPLPALAGTVAPVYQEVGLITPGLDSLQDLKKPPEETEPPDWDGQTIDRRFTIIGCNANHGAETEVVIGSVFSPCRVPVRVKFANQARRHAKLVLSPAVAAAAGDVRDKNYVQAITAVNTLFANPPSTPRMPVTTSSSIRTAFGSTPDATRMCFRLAQLWWYCVFHDKAKIKTAITYATQQPVRIEDTTGIIALLAAAKQQKNIVIIDTEKLGGDALLALTVLRYAAADQPYPQNRFLKLPSILTVHVAMPECSVYYTGDETINAIQPEFSSYDCWDAMFSYASQFTLTDTLLECVNYIGGLLYSRHEERDPMYNSVALDVHLPPLSMSHYALFPIALAADSIIGSDIPDCPDPFSLACVGVVRCQAFNVAFRDCMHGLGVGGVYRTPRYAAAAARWRTNLLKKSNRPYAPILTVISGMLAKVGATIGYSLLTCGTTIANPLQSDANVTSFMKVAGTWVELVDVLRAVPDAALDAIINPKKTTVLVQPGVRYKIDAISSAHMPGLVDMLSKCNAKFELLTKKKNDINWSAMPLPPAEGSFSLPSELPFPSVCADKWAQYKMVVTLPDAQSSIKAMHYNESRVGWHHYIVGTNEVAVPHMDDDPGALPDPGFMHGDLGPLPPAPTPDEVPEKLPPPDPSDPSLPAVPASYGANKLFDPEVKTLNDPVNPVHMLGMKDRVWVEDITEMLPPGAFHSLAKEYAAAVTGAGIPPSRTKRAHFTPILSALASTTREVSIATALASAPVKKRVGLANIVSNMANVLAGCTDSRQDQKTFMELAVRASNASKALAICPALSVEELAAEKLVYSQALPDFLSGFGPAITEAGISLGDYCVPVAEGIETRDIPATASDIAAAEAEGFKRNRNQDKAPPDVVIMYRKAPQAKPSFDPEQAMMHVFSEAEALQADAEAMVDALVARGAAEEGSGVERKAGRLLQFDLPAGDVERDRAKTQDIKAATLERDAHKLAVEELQLARNSVDFDWRKANNPTKKEALHSVLLAMDAVADQGPALSAQQIRDGIEAALSLEDQVFRAGEQQLKTTSSSQSTVPEPTPSAVPDVPDSWEDAYDPDALGPPPGLQQEQPVAAVLTDTQVEDLSDFPAMGLGLP